MNPRITRIASRFFLSACVAAAVFVASPALAFVGPVPNDCTVDGIQLQGMTELQARSVIASVSSVPTYTPIVAVVKGKTYSYKPSLILDIDKMVASAYSTATPAGYEIPVAWKVRYPSVGTWVKYLARVNDKPAVNAAYYVSGGVLRVRKSALGWKIDQPAARPVVQSALNSACVGSVIETLTLPSRIVSPTVTGANMGKAIFIDISQRKLRVYQVKRVVRTYSVAVGTGGHPTPRGTFRIIKKVKNPGWYNPGSAWAANMPSYIAPGPNNPLGTRALYLNAPGIRIHGTAKRSSIGTAASHGCVRMLRENIEALYPIIPVGTPVFIVP